MIRSMEVDADKALIRVSKNLLDSPELQAIGESGFTKPVECILGGIWDPECKSLAKGVRCASTYASGVRHRG